MNQYKTRPKGPVKYIKTNGTNTKPRDILYLTPSLETQDPIKRFIAKKCNQKISKKLSVANIVYKSSRLEYNLNTSNIGSSNKKA